MSDAGTGLHAGMLMQRPRRGHARAGQERLRAQLRLNGSQVLMRAVSPSDDAVTDDRRAIAVEHAQGHFSIRPLRVKSANGGLFICAFPRRGLRFAGLAVAGAPSFVRRGQHIRCLIHHRQNAARPTATARKTRASGRPARSAVDAAPRLLAMAQAGPLDELERARAQLLHAQVTFAMTRAAMPARSRGPSWPPAGSAPRAPPTCC
jgi:hypothetical protein